MDGGCGNAHEALGELPGREAREDDAKGRQKQCVRGVRTDDEKPDESMVIGTRCGETKISQEE
jgi:hypothetical protein